jgi:hypothetical protein
VEDQDREDVDAELLAHLMSYGCELRLRLDAAGVRAARAREGGSRMSAKVRRLDPKKLAPAAKVALFDNPAYIAVKRAQAAFFLLGRVDHMEKEGPADYSQWSDLMDSCRSLCRDALEDALEQVERQNSWPTPPCSTTSLDATSPTR